MLRFGRFEFDAVTRRLRSGGEDIHLAPRVFELLVTLLDEAPRVVSKRELHARLWPGGVVSDATLVALIKQLRAALGDHDRTEPLIRTVHRVGYALDARVTRDDEGTTAPPAGAARWLTVGQRRLTLTMGENLIGRDEAAQVRLDDPAVSRRHARIRVDACGALIEDLGSKNGTFIGEQPVPREPVALRDGDRVAFGTVVVTYRESGTASPTLTHIGPMNP